ncbi:MAG: NnrS family protein [Polyangiaceae bacterium]|nr:NnrS family protein [Polyangiaceae bacterium]
MSRSLAIHGEAPTPTSRPPFAISAKGFRPFFALAAAYAVLFVPLWLAIIEGVARPSSYLDPLSWHAHEMIFGFTVAVIAGFLLTAVGNWTQRETLVGTPLLGLAALWVVGRVGMLASTWLPRGVPAVLDLAFLPLLAVVLARPILATKNRRNFVMVGVLAVLSIANLGVHLAGLGVVPEGWARQSNLVAVDVIALMMLIIAGRIFPMFTRNATGIATIRSHRVLDVSTIVGMVALLIGDVIAADNVFANAIAGVVGLVGAVRAVHWGARHSTREPLLWILHAGYAWLVFGLVMRGASTFIPSLPSSLPTHAITVGAIGSLTLGMMARVSLGHTGRLLAAPRAMRWAFMAIVGAAFVRVAMPLLAPAWYRGSLVISGLLWTLSFATFLVLYAPILATPRLDGKPG